MPLSKTKHYSNGNPKSCGNGRAPKISIMEIFQRLADGETPKGISISADRNDNMMSWHLRKYRRNIGAATNYQALAILMRKGVVK